MACGLPGRQHVQAMNPCGPLEGMVNVTIVVLAFIFLGFLIGNLVGFSSNASTLGVLLPLLFTFAGGSAVAFLPKVEAEGRKLAAIAVIALSLSCLAGVYWGLFVSERQLLSPPEVRTSRLNMKGPRSETTGLYRASKVSAVNDLDQRFHNHELSANDAYEQLHELVTKGDKQ